MYTKECPQNSCISIEYKLYLDIVESNAEIKGTHLKTRKRVSGR